MAQHRWRTEVRRYKFGDRVRPLTFLHEVKIKSTAKSGCATGSRRRVRAALRCTLLDYELYDLTPAGWLRLLARAKSFAAAVASRCALDFNRATRKGFWPALLPGQAALPRGTGREMPRSGISLSLRHDDLSLRVTTL
jgi:hypothetical protein